MLPQVGTLTGWGLALGAHLLFSQCRAEGCFQAKDANLFSNCSLFFSMWLADIRSFLVLLSFPSWTFFVFFRLHCYSLSLMTYIKIICNNHAADSMLWSWNFLSTEEISSLLFNSISCKFSGHWQNAARFFLIKISQKCPISNLWNNICSPLKSHEAGLYHLHFF